MAKSGDAKGVSPPMSWSLEDVEAWLILLSASVIGGMQLSPDRDVFDQGFDRFVLFVAKLMLSHGFVVYTPHSSATAL